MINFAHSRYFLFSYCQFSWFYSTSGQLANYFISPDMRLVAREVSIFMAEARVRQNYFEDQWGRIGESFLQLWSVIINQENSKTYYVSLAQPYCIYTQKCSIPSCKGKRIMHFKSIFYSQAHINSTVANLTLDQVTRQVKNDIQGIINQTSFKKQIGHIDTEFLDT